MKRLAWTLLCLSASVLPAGPVWAAGPPVQLRFRDVVCYGFPGCPDSYLFLVPTLLVLGLTSKTRNVYALGGAWAASMVVLSIVLAVNPLRTTIYLLAAVAVGLVWLSFGGARR